MKRAVVLFAVMAVLAGGCGYINQERIPFEEKPGAPETTPVYNYEGWVIARASMHNHTTYSDGCRSPEDLVRQARAEGIAVLAITDHREGRLCLDQGKICANVGGVDSKETGYQKYFEHVNRLAAESQSPLIITGMEMVPYFWSERTFPWMLLKGEGWHFTVYGLSDAAAYSRAPLRTALNAKPEKYPELKPWVDFVNYVRDAGGMVFQAHPESSGDDWYGPVRIDSASAVDLTYRLFRLTGFAVAPSGSRIEAAPGGPWDVALFEYLAGFRQEPLWAWGEADYHCPPDTLRNGTTLFYLPKLGREEIFRAIETGSMVALMGPDFQDIYVAEFSVGDGRPAQEKIMLGRSVKLSGPAVIRFSANKDAPEQEVKLVRNGKVVFESKSAKFEYRDEEAAARKAPVYYRVMVMGRGKVADEQGNRLFTNPIFVDWNK